MGMIWSPPSSVPGWSPLRVGAGGFIRGMDLALADNTMVCRTDTYGGYVWNGSAPKVGPAFGSGMWEQLCSPDRFVGGDIASTTPGAQESFFANGGVHEIRIAPSNTSIFYMGYVGNLYKSTNRGASWVKCAGWTTLTANEMPTNNAYAQSGPKAAIDPINPNRVFYGVGFGSLGNVLKTLDGGSTFATISTGQIAQAVTGGTVYNIAFDPRASTQSGGNSNVIYCFSDGNGLYKSTDAGVTWTLQNSAGMPTTCIDLEVNPANGDVWVVARGGTLQELYKYSGSTWTRVTAATSVGVPWATIAFDPNIANNMALFEQASNLLLVAGSTDGGSTWQNNTNGTLVANDIPWLSLDHPGLNAGRAVCDNNHTYYVSDGIGIWYMSQPPASAAFNITSRSAGIEQLITNTLISPPGGNPVVFSWDRAAFVIVNPKVYPSTYYPGSAFTGTAANEINHGWDGDWASADPSFICCFADAVNGCFYSLNKGVTWADFAHSPPPRIGGMIAASTNLNMVAGTSNNGTLYYTLDRGATAWVSLESYFNTNFSVPLIGGQTGWGNSYTDNRHYIAADRVLANTFYVFNDGSGGAGGGIYRSTDGGQTWTKRSTPTFLGNYGWLKSVPNINATSTSGHLFFGTGIGNAPHPAAQPLYRSTDGGATWSDVNSLLRDVFAFGFGKNNQGSYPAIGAYGWYNGVGGFWVSKDNGASFTKFGELTLYGTSDIVDAVTGDSNTADLWYVGLHDAGSAYYGP